MSTHAVSLLPTVLLVYDHFLTLDAEVAFIWRPGHERASAWFLAIRYFSLCANIAMACLMFIDFTPEVRFPVISPQTHVEIRRRICLSLRYMCGLIARQV